MEESPITRLLTANAARRVRIGVLGDTILDCYVDGICERLSPEGPHPVLRVGKGGECTVPGGAANVARQLKPWNVEPVLLSLLDHETTEILQPLWGLSPAACVCLTRGRLPVKTRLVANGRTLLRLDREEPHFGEPKIGDLRLALHGCLHEVCRAGLDALVVADYHKGCLGNFLVAEAIRLAPCPVIVDPKRRPAPWCKRATVLKCNAVESVAYQEHDGPLLVTHGAVPPVLYRWQGGQVPIEAVGPPVQAVSVSGAGDHFAALLALALAHGLPLPEAAQLAHESGACYVQRPYNEPVLPHELHARYDPAGSKIAETAAVRTALGRRRPGKVVFTNGCFDLLHAGHLSLLERARRLGDVLIVGLNDDASVRRLKGPRRPIVPQQQRARLLAALPCVDWVVTFGEDAPVAILKELRPDLRVKARAAELNPAGNEYCGAVALLEPLSGCSTTATVARAAA